MEIYGAGFTGENKGVGHMTRSHSGWSDWSGRLDVTMGTRPRPGNIDRAVTRRVV